MRVLFWRRRNARLAERLTAVIEASERVRKSYRPKPPRVVIDTSYVRANMPAEAVGPPVFEAAEDAQFDGRPVPPGDATEHAIGYDYRTGDDTVGDRDDGQNEALTGVALGGEDLDILREAVEQLEDADRREAEAREREAAARAEAAAERARAVRLEAEAARERAARIEAQAGREEAEAAAADALRELATLREFAGSFEQADLMLAEAGRREAAAQTEAQAQGARAVCLATALAGQEAALRELMGRCGEAERAAADARRETDSLRETVRQLEQAESQRSEGLQREAALLAALEVERERAARLEADTEQVKAARREVEERCTKAQRAAEEAERELELLREAARQVELADRREAAALQREATAAQQAEALAERVAELEAALAREQAAHRDSLARCENAVPVATEPALPAKLDQGAMEPVGLPMRRPRVEAGAALAGDARLEDSVQVLNEKTSDMRQLLARRSKAPAVKAEPVAHGAAAFEATGTKPAVVEAAVAVKAEASAPSQRRRDQRVASRTPVSIWRQGMSQPMACTLIDKSASGAKIELAPPKFGESGHGLELVVGGKLTLTFSIALERTSVPCEVAWVEGKRAGLRYCGPFHTEVVGKPRKPTRLAR